MRAFVLVCCTLVLSIAAAQATDEADQQLQVCLRAHIEFLADDLINNGALDNASGISVMLETARLFAQGKSPGRSILFVVTITGLCNSITTNPAMT